jgi:hypothetical protein
VGRGVTQQCMKERPTKPEGAWRLKRKVKVLASPRKDGKHLRHMLLCLASTLVSFKGFVSGLVFSASFPISNKSLIQGNKLIE